MNKLKSLLALSAVGSLLTACSQGQSAPPVVQQVNPATIGKLQFAVGNATLVSVSTTGVVTQKVGINIVSTFRQANGLSAVLLDTPTIGGPWTLPPAVADAGDGIDPYATIQDGGPSMQDFGTGVLSGTPQTVHLGAPPCDTAAQCPGSQPNTTTFGQSGGVFGMGIQPANSTTNTTPYSVVPYTEPIFAPGGPGINSAAINFVPWGGPPAFDDPKDKDGMGTRDGLHNLGAGLLGWNMGITAFQLPAQPASGTYTMGVSVPTGQNQSGQSSFATITSTAIIKAATVPLAPLAPPVLVEDGKGGGTFSVTLPPGATEGYVEFVDWGPGGGPDVTDPVTLKPHRIHSANCQGSLGAAAFPVYYTVAVHGGGPQTGTLPDTIGPNTTQGGPSTLTPSMTLCTAAANTAALGAPTAGDNYQTIFIATDYPLYEGSYPANTSQLPALLGPNGQDDITISGTQSASTNPAPLPPPYAIFTY